MTDTIATEPSHHQVARRFNKLPRLPEEVPEFLSEEQDQEVFAAFWTYLRTRKRATRQAGYYAKEWSRVVGVSVEQLDESIERLCDLGVITRKNPGVIGGRPTSYRLQNGRVQELVREVAQAAAIAAAKQAVLNTGVCQQCFNPHVEGECF